MTEPIFVPYPELLNLVRDILEKAGLSEPHARTVARFIAEGERDECRSHGLYRLPWVVRCVKDGTVSPDATPDISVDETVIIRADAKGAYSPLAFETALPLLEKKAKRFGLAALAITNCHHFQALWPQVEEIARRGLAAIAMNPSQSSVAPAGGTKALLGTNPFAFAWPRPGKHPYAFDFATSVVARGEIELHRLDGKEIPIGWGIDAEGKPTTDPAAALAGAMLPFGGHKGSAISSMVELLGGALIGDFMAFGVTAYDAGRLAVPRHGEITIAFSPEVFGGARTRENQERAEQFFGKVEAQGARLPSSRRYEARERSMTRGVALSEATHRQLMGLLKG